MRAEMLPDMTNVVRFPIERRAPPTLALLREIAPDRRMVLSIAVAFDLDVPPRDLRRRADAATAARILNHPAGAGGTLAGVLDDLLDPVIARAIAACRAAHGLSVAAATARQVLLDAQTASHVWTRPQLERAETLTYQAAALLIEAHARVEEAEGVARAVGLARRGEAWAPQDRWAKTETLLGMAGTAR
jgi:hypothetical protein